jgi:hypothetical protein
MKSIDGKVFFSESANSGLIEIRAQIPKWQETLLFIWVLAWTFCGLVVIVNFFGEYTREEKLMMLVYILFWIYFEYKAVYAFLWKKWGKEFIKIDEEGIRYKRDINSYGKSSKYFKENIKKFSAIDVKEKSFISSYYQSFWMVGNESIQFEHLGKKVGIALGCDNKQRDEVLKFLKYQQKKLHLK